jgi:hypothetical protein
MYEVKICKRIPEKQKVIVKTKQSLKLIQKIEDITLTT